MTEPVDLAPVPARERWLLAAFVLLIIGLRVYHAPGYPYHEDEAGSISVMRSIVETGLPLAENGSLYWRSLLGHYLMAIPLVFTEISPVSTRLICILFSGLVLPVVFAMGRRTGGTVAGWLAVLFLGFSAFENLFASMARFYLPFQFFFVAAVYFAGEFFIRRRSSAGLWLTLSTIGALGTHSLSIELSLVFLVALLLGSVPPAMNRLKLALAFVAVAAAGLFFLVYTPENLFVNYSAIPLIPFALDDKLAFYHWFRQLTPLGVSLLILGIYPLWRDQDRLTAYYFFSFVYCLGLLSLVAPGDNPRYMCNLYPLAIVVIAATLAWIGRHWRKVVADFTNAAEGRLRQARVVIVVVLMATGYAVVFENVDIPKGFGYYFRFVDQQPAHEYLLRRMLPGDELISTEPSLTKLYLGRAPDYFLREKMDPDGETYSVFTRKEKAGSAFTYLDSPMALERVLSEDKKRIWLYTNWKIVFTISPETDRIVVGEFRPVFSQRETYVLVRP